MIIARTRLLIAFIAIVLPGAGGTADAGGYWTCSGWPLGAGPGIPPIRYRHAPAAGRSSITPARRRPAKAPAGNWGPAGLSPQPICTLITHDAAARSA